MSPRLPVWLGAAAVIALGVNATPAQAQTIRGCANPAGQIRIIGDTGSCRSQETLVEWNNEGGVTGGSDRGPTLGPAFLSGTPTALSTDNQATGFAAYMVWANVAVEFNTGNMSAGTFPSASSASCNIAYTVVGRPDPPVVVDARSVAFPITALGAGTNQIVRLNIGLTGMAGPNSTPPVSASEFLDFSLNCGSNAGPTPPPNSVPVKALSYSLSGIGVNNPFDQ